MTTEDHFEYAVVATCPVPNAHRRLEQAHRLWHQAMDVYGEPEAFLTNFNAVIEALRNVTFVLQGEKERLSGFETWYSTWQQSLKSDPIMQWLNGARVTVVHKSDLEITSTARVRVHNNVVRIVDDLSVPPMAPTALICEMLAEQMPDTFRASADSLVIAVERAWRVAELGEVELLDGLGRAYAHLRRLVDDAHRHGGRACPAGAQTANEQGALPCMVATAGLRTVRLSLADGAPILTKKVRINKSFAGLAAVTERYGPLPIPEDGRQRSMEEQAAVLMQVAKQMLARDGFHLRFFHLYADGRLVSLVQGDTETRATKYALLREIAEEVLRYNADAVLDIAEAWQAPFDELRHGGEAQHAPSRREVLVITVARKSGACLQLVTPFTRDNHGAIHFEQTVSSSVPFPPYLTPVAEAWGLTKASAPAG